MLAAMSLDIAAQPQQNDNAVESVTFKNDGINLIQKDKEGSDFKDIFTTKLEEETENTPNSLSASICTRINESLDNKNTDKLKPGEAAKIIEALLKVLRGKKATAGGALPAADRANLLNLLKSLEEFIKKGLEQGFLAEKGNLKRLKELKQEIFSLITANGSGQAGSAAEKKSEEITITLPSAADADIGKEKPVRFTLVDLRKGKAAGKSAALVLDSNSAPGKETSLSEAVSKASEHSESSRQSIPAEFKAENGQILVRTFSFETGESKRGVEGISNLSETFRRLFIPEIVRKSGIILKDGGKGEIKLILKPESLGRVRIRINIQDNSIEGKILVENNTVRELFEGNLEHLKNAFRSEGFDSAALEVAVGGEKSGRDPAKEELPTMSKEGALDEFERSMPLLADFYREDLLIDLVV